ncbi:MAG: hypothetical protein M3Q48_03705 [Actinomycetota bacterium]|nr:hypothetical protein [Actinomycetota bacterium]
MTPRNRMVGFELPTSTHVARETVTPEVEEVALLLGTAFEVVPEVAEVLALAATTGMRRGELVGIRKSALRLKEAQLRVAAAVSGKRVKSTKTGTERDVSLDEETAAMLGRSCGSGTSWPRRSGPSSPTTRTCSASPSTPRRRWPLAT